MSALLERWKSTQPVYRFLIGFIGMMLVFYMVYKSSLYETYIMTPLLSGQAFLANAFLNLIGFKTQAMGDGILGDQFRVSIKDGCDGMEATAIYVFAILAFPMVALRQKWKGLITGVLILGVLNIIRIAGLYLAGIYWPQGFEFLHLHGGVVIFIIIAVCLWLIWVNQISSKT
ncbi:MAG: archaeosortase/exosortase family protein [Saprospiraceae bacterium]|jgi:exosortase/archaeosortase family protein|nr:archaeosortase/exosortase family protein [Candidatus Defluviibacterium haderslevense]MBK7242302.1 archaeosortase/exosortase family protein [Candidatus Defluviibacterium haderslevense]MCI1268111.1 exosortase/archaeosortase family protein [Saprospiraceae bacterium]